MYLIFLVALVILLALLYYGKREGYSSVGNEVDNYYQWRSYSQDPYKEQNMTGFPYNYHPYEYNKRFDSYDPSDLEYDYGYGSW